MANHKIQDVEGIGPATDETLRAAGVKDTDSLLAGATTAARRKELAEAEVDKWVEQAKSLPRALEY
jgi:predicted flap endonuclease-1-like 5' DNA nuclease